MKLNASAVSLALAVMTSLPGCSNKNRSPICASDTQKLSTEEMGQQGPWLLGSGLAGCNFKTNDPEMKIGAILTADCFCSNQVRTLKLSAPCDLKKDGFAFCKMEADSGPSICGLEGGVHTLAVIKGKFDEQGTHQKMEDVYSISCDDGAVNKCMNGLRPKGATQEKSATNWPWRFRPADNAYYACLRSLRADYCGTGHSNTVTGKKVDLYWIPSGAYEDDHYRPEVSSCMSDLCNEAAFGIEGANCVEHARMAEQSEGGGVRRLLHEQCPGTQFNQVHRHLWCRETMIRELVGLRSAGKDNHKQCQGAYALYPCLKPEQLTGN